MVTYAQLREEAVWRDQFTPPRLADLGERLERFFDPDRTNIGIFGDNRHLKGYHRSRRWIRESRYCTNRTYSVSETDGNRSGGNPNWISGIDIVVGEQRSWLIFKRINYVRQKGRIPYVLQVLLERDPWHVHLSLDRAHANDDHTELYDIITGADMDGSPDVSFEIELPVLRQGSEGGDVVTAQALLGARGFATAIDGEFGPDTNEQTRAMQSRYGAELVDGVWGKETWTIAITGEDRL